MGHTKPTGRPRFRAAKNDRFSRVFSSFFQMMEVTAVYIHVQVECFNNCRRVITNLYQLSQLGTAFCIYNGREIQISVIPEIYVDIRFGRFFTKLYSLSC
jgi:hypothetical protein